MTIQWSGDDDPPPPQPRRVLLPYGTLVGAPIDLEEGSLPSTRSRRDIAVIATLVLLIVVLGVAVWFVGPLPRVFPLIS